MLDREKLSPELQSFSKCPKHLRALSWRLRQAHLGQFSGFESLNELLKHQMIIKVSAYLLEFRLNRELKYGFTSLSL